MARLSLASQIAAPIALAATALAAIQGIPSAVWIATASLAAATWLGGVLFGYADSRYKVASQFHTGSFSWEPESADILIVKGGWIYDAAHEGWNEIHPVKHCQRVGTWSGRWMGDPTGLCREWEQAIERATRASATESLARESSPTWSIHPLVDGIRLAA